MHPRSSPSMLVAAVHSTAAVLIASSATADVVGLMANLRTVSGGYLVNVFAVTDNASDGLTSISGGQTGLIRAIGGNFIQGNATVGSTTQAVWKPTGTSTSAAQSWTTLDSFLTVGGGYNTSTGIYAANGGTLGDPSWNAPGPLDEEGNPTVLSGFSTPSFPGFDNPFLNVIPPTAGWFIVGFYSPARTLAGITNRIAATSDAALQGEFGFMLAQFYVPPETTAIEFNNMRPWVRRLDGSGHSQILSLTITVPAPGAIVLLGIAGMSRSRRRRD
jgi:hypothetical protein